MSYILISANDDLTSQERAELITRELYNIKWTPTWTPQP